MGIVQQTHDVMKNFLTKILLLISLTPLVLKAQHFNIRTTEIIFKENSPYIAFGKLHMPLSTCHLISYMEEISNYDGYQNSPLVIDYNGTVVFYLNETYLQTSPTVIPVATECEMLESICVDQRLTVKFNLETSRPESNSFEDKRMQFLDNST